MVPFNFYQFLIVSVICFFLVQCSTITKQRTHEQSFEYWLKNYKKSAVINLGIPKESIDEIFKNVHYDNRVINSNSYQTEFINTKTNYIKRFVTKTTISNGKKFLKEHKSELDKVEKDYKVPSYIIVSLLGIESSYGTKVGNFNALDTISTLAYDDKHSKIFTSELNSLVILINRGDVPVNVKSSSEGALGASQFMPKNHIYYDVDKNLDGKVDLFNNYDEIFASVANYLRQIGWNHYIDWGYEVTLPKNFDTSLASLDISKPIYVWQNMGVKRLGYNNKFPNISALSKLIIIDDGRAFLVTSNFDIIMKWNKSVSFALSVGLISDELKKYNTYLNNQKETNNLNKKLDSLEKFKESNNKNEFTKKIQSSINKDWDKEQLSKALEHKNAIK